MGTFVIGICAMLAIIGQRQWKMGYKVAGGLSLLVAAIIIIGALLLIPRLSLD